jgi:hypothetical protein
MSYQRISLDALALLASSASSALQEGREDANLLSIFKIEAAPILLI